MSISEPDVRRVARLANIALDDADVENTQTELNGMLTLIGQLQCVDTEGVAPLAHPLSVMQDVSLRLREDKVDRPVDKSVDASADAASDASARRERLMRNAPARHDGLFLVPAVIE